MKALITGASSGLGESFSHILHNKGYELILVARRIEKLEKLKEVFGDNTIIIKADLSDSKQVFSLYEEIKNEDIEIVINNAGFGKLGNFDEIELSDEISMINTNITAVHILTKLFIKDFIKKDHGYILNVASIASFLASPYFCTYYATKAYVKTLTESIRGELKDRKSNVYIGVLCPGPIATGFDVVANASTSLKGASADYVANYAINKMFKKKLIILPKISVKLAVFFSKFLPRKLLIFTTGLSQKKKLK